MRMGNPAAMSPPTQVAAAARPVVEPVSYCGSKHPPSLGGQYAVEHLFDWGGGRGREQPLPRRHQLQHQVLKTWS